MGDLEDRSHIDMVVRKFYRSAMIDAEIGHFFTDIVQLDLEEHLPRIVDFWESVLFGTGSYRGNPVLKHVELNAISPISSTHFERWLDLWNAAVEHSFSGPKSEEMINKARLMADLMRYKIEASSGTGFVQ